MSQLGCTGSGGAACTCPPSLVFCTPTFSPRQLGPARPRPGRREAWFWPRPVNDLLHDPKESLHLSGSQLLSRRFLSSPETFCRCCRGRRFHWNLAFTSPCFHHPPIVCFWPVREASPLLGKRMELGGGAALA